MPFPLDDFLTNCPAEDYSVTLRKSLAEYITQGKVAELFAINTFDIEEKYVPFDEIHKLNEESPDGKLYLQQLPVDEDLASRANLALAEVGVLIGFRIGQKNSGDTSGLDTLVNLINQFKYVCRTFEHHANYSWLRTETIKDQNGTPMAYVSSTQAGTFQTYFTAFYRYHVL
jgi:hypothetical protein